MLARKSVTQRFKPSESILSLMHDFKAMTNICIEIGLRNDASSLKRLSLLSYQQLKSFQIPSCYKLCAISKAAGILASRKKSIRRGYPTKNPYLNKLIITSYRGFKISNGKLRIPLGEKRFEEVPLVQHTLQILSMPALRVNSFTLTERSLSLSISREVVEMKRLASTVGVVGVDRNLNNLTVGNAGQATYYDLSKVVEIAETTRSIIRSFKRNDVRIRRRISGKYELRRTNRRAQILHVISKHVVESAVRNRQGIVFEDIREIRRLYQKGNGQSKRNRGRMNSWPYAEIKRQIEYKATWEGVPVIHLTKSETRGTSQLCPKCGERLQSGKELKRKLWCQKCRIMFDRDYVAVVNIARRGRLRFRRSKGEAVEAMVSVFKPSVDASKLTSWQQPTS